MLGLEIMDGAVILLLLLTGMLLAVLSRITWLRNQRQRWPVGTAPGGGYPSDALHAVVGPDSTLARAARARKDSATPRDRPERNLSAALLARAAAAGA
jgi:hypothetical protein